MLDKVDIDTVKGKRDKAILALLIGCLLRRSELVALDMDSIKEIDGRKVVPELLGKRSKKRTVPVQAWVMNRITDWVDAAGLTEGPLFVGVMKSGRLRDNRLSSQAIWDVVKAYSPVEGLAPHDLRRTSAKLLYEKTKDIEQIRLLLGHDDVKTTMRYLGSELNIENAVNDALYFS